ncbi:endonuclease/exonuclease/phosphatase family protein [Inhella proteolytica]|uniref:Type I secretion C-terminal target domain-containing protein n=1 Tax=Inhella proteolytica TaxID=2795029 RepID=A0A931J3V9_9BURK|nr:endonuclease/exonuclease/phosphatase family protein [Inhella proteolytica]MBH9575827.1 type I secretion C-terminal target domain-containing protein [Inhella proteolytica]
MISLTTLGSAYTQNFDSLPTSGTSSTLPAGWVILESGTNANATLTAGTGSSNTGDTYSFGQTGSTDRALGGLLSGSLTPMFGVAFTNNTGALITELQISYRGEQWRLGTLNREDRLDFQGSLDATALNTGTWHDLNNMDFIAPVRTGSVGALNGNLDANSLLITNIAGLSIAPGATFWLRWTDFNASGSDDGLAIDDFSITPIGTAPAKPSVSLSVSSNSGSEAAGSQITVTATASSAVSGDETVQLGVSGTGIEASDYLLSATSITIPAGQTSASVTLTIQNDSLPEPDENLVLTLSSPSSGIDLGGTISQTVKIVDDDALPTRIHEIQAASHLSPLNGQAVRNVQGIVTAKASNGFYIQDPQPDADPATSEGIFVFTGAGSALLTARTVGEAVLVSGTVTEFRAGGDANNLTLTEITNSAGVQPLSVGPWTAGASLSITPLVLGTDRVPPTQAIHNDAASNVETGGDFDPAGEGIDFWESLEGMLVRVEQPLAVSPTLSQGSSESIWVLARNGAGATGLTGRGGIEVSASDFNPERILLDDMDNALVMPSVHVGARLGTVDGVVDYNANNFNVRVTSAPALVSNDLQRETTALGSDGNHLRVATFNVENLDPGDGAAKFNALAQAIVGNLHAPEILNLEEVQDNNGPTNNGVVDATQTLQALVNAIQAAGGPRYEWRQIDPVNNQDGGEPGGNIRTVFLFDPARVSFVEGSLSRLTDPMASGSNDGAFESSRKPLVGSFVFNGETVTLVGNHFNSKGGDQPLYGPTQPPVLGSETQRMQQAAIVKSFVEGQLASNPNAKVLVLGDLNDFQFSNPVNLLESGGLTALIDTLPVGERYTYNYQGNAQAIDHVLASQSLAGLLRGYDVVHMNSEFVDQISDHDPVLARFFIERAGSVLEGTRGRDTLVGTSGADRITGGQGRDTLTGGAGNDAFVYTSLLDAGDQITDFTPGQDRLDVSALLAAVGYAGSTPFADGYLSLLQQGANTVVYFDADGAAGAGQARPLVELVGVLLGDPGLLLDPGF